MAGHDPYARNELLTVRALQFMFWTSLVLAVFLLLGCVPAQAIRQAKTEAAINRAHMLDEDLPEEARLIGQDNYDAWSAQLFNLDGTPLPADVQERVDGRSQ